MIELAAMEQFAFNPSMSRVNSMTRRLFGVPVVVTTALRAGTGICGDFAGSAEVYVTEERRRRRRDHEIRQIVTTVEVLDRWESMAMAKLVP